MAVSYLQDLCEQADVGLLQNLQVSLFGHPQHVQHIDEAFSDIMQKFEHLAQTFHRKIEVRVVYA